MKNLSAAITITGGADALPAFQELSAEQPRRQPRRAERVRLKSSSAAKLGE